MRVCIAANTAVTALQAARSEADRVSGHYGRDLDAFARWFEWSFHSVVVDLSGHPLLREELWPARVPSLAAVGDGLSYWTLRRRDDALEALPVCGQAIKHCGDYVPGLAITRFLALWPPALPRLSSAAKAMPAVPLFEPEVAGRLTVETREPL